MTRTQETRPAAVRGDSDGDDGVLPSIANVQWRLWGRMPTVVGISSFLFAYLGPAAGIAWLAGMLVAEIFAHVWRQRMLAGHDRYRSRLLAITVFTNTLWVVHALLLWRVGGVIPQIIAIIDLFLLILFAVVGIYRNRTLMLSFLVPPMMIFSLLMVSDLFAHASLFVALFGTVAVLGTDVLIVFNGMLLHNTDRDLVAANARLASVTNELKDNRAFLEDISSMANVGGWHVDVATDRLTLNDCARRIYEMDDDFEVTRESILTFYDPDTTRMIREAIAKARGSGEIWRFEVPATTATGRQIWLNSVGRPVLENGRCVRLIGAIQDITAQVVLTQKLAGLAREAEEASQAKSNFLANMSHELRTPLNAIIGFSELCLSDAFAARRKDYAALIHEAGTHLLSLINDVLDLSKIEAGGFEIHDGVVDMAAVAAECIDLMRVKADEGSIDLRFERAAALPAICADLRAIKQIALNLLSNALKFTPAGGSVALFAHLERSGEFALGVRDTGIGIPPDEREKVFDSFGQGRHDALTVDKGTGLGLPIVKGLALAMGGRIVLDSEVDRGTCVTVYLPAGRVLSQTTAAMAGGV
jgi:signal transduction histidine kinase